MVEASQSLKEKRRVLKSLEDRLRRSFNVSISEVDAHDLWQRAVLGVACVGMDRAGVNRTLSLVVKAMEEERAVSVLHYALNMQ